MIQNQEPARFDSAAILADVQYPMSPVGWAAGAATTVVSIAGLIYAAKRNVPSDHENSEEPGKFTNDGITAGFVAAIPAITRELNLELAVATQIQTFTRSSRKTMLWGLVDLGMNVVQIRIPVAYRFHIELLDPWELRVDGEKLLVHAPVLRASLPPAVHTSQIERVMVRGWCRKSPKELINQLERQITPALSLPAADPKQLNHVRDACRQSLAEFVRLWLERERQYPTAKPRMRKLRIFTHLPSPSPKREIKASLARIIQRSRPKIAVEFLVEIDRPKAPARTHVFLFPLQPTQVP